MTKVLSKNDEAVKSLDESLKVLQPEDNFIEINGEKVYVKQYKFAQLLRALKHLSNLYQILVSSQDNIEAGLLKGVAEHTDDILALISLATGKDVDFFDSIEADEGLELAILTYKVNESFSQRI